MNTHVSKLVVLLLTACLLSVPAFSFAPNVVHSVKHGPSVPPDPWDGAKVAANLSDDGPPCSGASVFPPMGCMSAADMLNIQSPEALPIDNNLLASLPEMTHMLTALAIAKANRNSPLNTPVATSNLTDCDPNDEGCDDGHGPSMPPCPSDGQVAQCELVCIYWFFCFTICDTSCT